MKEWIWGKHSVEAALANPRRKVLHLFLEAEKKALPPAWAQRCPCTLITSPQQWRNILPPEAVHQGMAAQIRPLEDVNPQELFRGPGPIVVLDQVTDPHNVGAIWRGAAIFGASAVVLTKHHSPPLDGIVAKSASGALEYVPALRVANVARFLEQAQKNAFFVLGLSEHGKTTISMAATAYAREKVVIVLGAEGKGLRTLTQKYCDELVSIETAGPFSTLNVSTAAAVVLYALTTGKRS